MAALADQRGRNHPLGTRLWTANAADPVLCSIGAPRRRATLIAVPEPEGQLRFDIFLQGERETVFFDV